MIRDLVLTSLIIGVSSIYKGYKQPCTPKAPLIKESIKELIVTQTDSEISTKVLTTNYFSIFKKGSDREPPEDTVESYFKVDEKGKLLKYHGLDSDVRIPKVVNNIKVVTIGKKAFYKRNLNSVVIPHGIVKIEESAFEWNKLTKIELPNTLKFIGNHAFSSNELESLDLPLKIKSIGSWAFAWNKIETLTIPKSLKVLSYCSFYANKLTKLTIHTGVVTIDAYAFGKNELTNVHLPKTIMKLDERAFSYNELEYVSLPNTLTINREIEDELVSNPYHFYEPVKGIEKTKQ